jgi:hypothetical protein
MRHKHVNTLETVEKKHHKNGFMRMQGGRIVQNNAELKRGHGAF